MIQSAGDVLGGVGGLIGGLIVAGGAAGKGGEKSYKKAIEVFKKLQTSDFDFRALDPPELQILGEMMPEVYDAVVPAEFQQVADSPAARQSQVRALGQMEQIADEGLPLEDRLAAAEAGRTVTSAAGAARADALRNMAARGGLSGGDALQAMLAGDQQASNLGRDLGSDLARQAALRRMAGIESASGMAANLRAGDVGLNQTNADIANRFAELFSTMKTQQARDAAAARQGAQAYNVQTRQQVGNENAINRYNTALQNLTRQNALRGNQFNQELQRAQGLSGAYFGLGQTQDAARDAKAQAIIGAGQGAGQAGGGLFGLL